eukprot:15968386-Heterocapsa_arctica.AAC.1
MLAVVAPSHFGATRGSTEALDARSCSIPSCQQSPGRALLDIAMSTSCASTSCWTRTTTVTRGAR